MPAFRLAGALFEEVHVQEVRDLIDPSDVRAVFFERELFLIARGSPGALIRVAPLPLIPAQQGRAASLGYFLRNPLALEEQLARLRQQLVPGARPIVGRGSVA